MRHVPKCLIVLLILLTQGGPAAAGEDEERAAKQAELDATCEVARAEKLAPLKARYIEECVAKKERPDRESCERFYADYGNRTGNRPPLFYDLPACVAAHDYRMKGR